MLTVWIKHGYNQLEFINALLKRIKVNNVIII